MSAGDHELLRRYAEDGAQDAFATLVERYIDLVYSAARRQVRSGHLAEDVAQAVFIELARQAARLKPDTILPAWLHTVTRRRAIDVIRRESSQRAREQTAVEIAEMNTTPSVWTRVEPILDEAMAMLPDDDRTVVLLRFFENRSLREIGRIVGTSEDAAQKRVGRALERLRSFFFKSGVSVSAAALAAEVSTHAIQAAPAGLALTVTTASCSSGIAVASTAIPAVQTLAMTTIQKVLVSSGLAVAIAGGLYQAQVIRDQQRRLDELERASDIVRQERDWAQNDLASMRAEMRATDAMLEEAESLLGDLADMGVGGESLTSVELKSWAERRRQLKEWAELMPDRTIPEMRLLTETDWLQASREADLVTHEGVRKALSSLRELAKLRFLPKLREALGAYASANDNALPTDVVVLEPYFAAAIDPAILRRYQIWDDGSSPGREFSGHWQISEHANAMVDHEYETTLTISDQGVGMSTWNRAAHVLRKALYDFRAATNRSEPENSAELLSFVPDPTDEAVRQTVEEWVEWRRKESATEGSE